MMKKILILFLFSVSLCALFFPELIVTHKVSPLLLGDYNLEYVGSFTLTSFFYQGGIQLWNYFGQMPFLFFYTTLGMFKLPNVLTALVYYCLSPFTDHPAQFFHQVFLSVDVLVCRYCFLYGSVGFICF